MSAPMKFTYDEPKDQEAIRWLPDQESSIGSMISWLIKRHATFEVRYSLPDNHPFDSGDPVLMVQSGQGQNDHAAWPGDWVIRYGPDSFGTWDDDSFQAHYTMANSQ